MYLDDKDLEALIFCVGRVVGLGQKKAFGRDLEQLQVQLRDAQRQAKAEREEEPESTAGWPPR